MKNSSWFKKESGFRNGSRMFDEKLTILEFKYLLNKKWKKQAVKSTRTKNSYRRVIISLAHVRSGTRQIFRF